MVNDVHFHPYLARSLRTSVWIAIISASLNACQEQKLRMFLIAYDFY